MPKKRTTRDIEKPIKDMLKGELVDALQESRMKLKLLQDAFSSIPQNSPLPVKSKKRWAVYDRGHV
jgi:hypothetical protein